MRLLPRSLAWPVAPALGWAVHSAIALPIFSLIGMNRATVTVVFGISILLALATVRKKSRFQDDNGDGHNISLLALAGAMVLAAVVMAAILPTATDTGFALAGPIFDHSKVAMIDDMARLGVPAGNPFFGEVGGPSRLSYYYLWHFSAAELAVLTGFGGWEADAGLTWFTAFSSLTLMMGFANWLSGRSTAANWVLVLAATATIRPILVWLLGWKIAYEFTGWPTGFGAWLFQVTWAPQHVASAGCTVILTMLLVQMAQRRNVLSVVVTAMVVAAQFESSAWIGAVTFPLASAVIVPSLVVQIKSKVRIHFVISLAVAAALAIVIASPLVYDQALASIARASGSPIGIMPYEILGGQIPDWLRAILDVPVYWTLFLFTEFAPFYPIGIVMLAWLWKDKNLSQNQIFLVRGFGLLTIVSLGVGSLLISKIGANNDLGWRGVLPAVLVLIISSAAGIARYLASVRRFYAFGILGLIGLACFSGVRAVYDDIYFQPQASAERFGRSEEMWKAVRSHSGKADRVANNPLFLSDMTNWPINISWALLANRRSCYAGSDLALPFVPLPQERRAEIDAQFTRVFDGRPETNDLIQLSGLYDCSVVVITPQDGAWIHDPFASSPLYGLVETHENSWRIYKRKPGA